MTKPTGFLTYARADVKKEAPHKRAAHWKEFTRPMSTQTLQEQGARCMDCAVPFCHTGTEEVGCPIHNLIPEWNELVYRNQWKEALVRLHKTNNFPEFTGRVCPAPCEGSCVAALHGDAVAIKSIENHIVERGFAEGWIIARPPKVRTEKTVAIVGSGPAGLAAADQLNQAGHTVTVFERDDRVGGLLTYGIPDVKLPFSIIERRINLLREEGISFETGVDIGSDISAAVLRESFDAVILATGATKPRDLSCEGRTLDGVHFAMDFLRANTKSLLDSNHQDEQFLSAAGKHVIVIGGGDTGADCITTSVRHGALSVTQFDINAQKGFTRASENAWPLFPIVHTVSDAHEEAIAIYGEDPRAYKLQTKRFLGANGHVTGLETIEVNTTIDAQGRKTRTEVPGSEQVWHADLVLLALGFEGADATLCEALGVQMSTSQTVAQGRRPYETSVPGVFAAGDNRRGQSLVVWAIDEGRKAAAVCDRFLGGR
ncbi:glutamate synthase subunit beta [Bacillus sp. FSL W7-1360]